MNTKQKIFSLISGDTVHPATGKKVVKSDDYQTLVSSVEVLEAVKKDAENYRKQVAEECEALKEQAVKEGFGEGYRQWTIQLAKLEEEIAKIKDDMQKVIIPVALKAAKKIVARELEITPEAIVEIVQNTLKSVSQHKRIVIYVNKQDYDILDKNKEQLRKVFESLESLSLRDRDDVEPGGCIIETEGGIINAQLKDRWQNLEAAFQDLAETIQKGQ